MVGVGAKPRLGPWGAVGAVPAPFFLRVGQDPRGRGSRTPRGPCTGWPGVCRTVPAAAGGVPLRPPRGVRPGPCIVGRRSGTTVCGRRPRAGLRAAALAPCDAAGARDRCRVPHRAGRHRCPAAVAGGKPRVRSLVRPAGPVGRAGRAGPVGRRVWRCVRRCAEAPGRRCRDGDPPCCTGASRAVLRSGIAPSPALVRCPVRGSACAVRGFSPRRRPAAGRRRCLPLAGSVRGAAGFCPAPQVRLG
ncbi:hypothetical protein SAMN05421806_12723 [Streptomyces indicus]|uniref:Uncharacterized protein n=1 Tax=Streptomyces indicus TaxID=417292 RepID=A0A1G9J3W4_9ACTN|nr:hypothetical protein SAMN05421806_12723 [Streptomyces indicus]